MSGVCNIIVYLLTALFAHTNYMKNWVSCLQFDLLIVNWFKTGWTAALLLQFRRTKLDVLAYFFKQRIERQLSNVMLLKPPLYCSSIYWWNEVFHYVILQSIYVQTASIKRPRFLAGLVPIDTLLYFSLYFSVVWIGVLFTVENKYQYPYSDCDNEFIKTLQPDKCIF